MNSKLEDEIVTQVMRLAAARMWAEAGGYDMSDPDKMPVPLVGWKNLGEYFLSIYSIALLAVGVKMFLSEGADSQVAVACFGFLSGLGMLCVALIEVVKIHAQKKCDDDLPASEPRKAPDRVL